MIYNWYNGRGKISGKIIAALLFRVCYLSWTIEPDEQQFLEHCRLRNCLTLFIVLFSHVDCHLFGRTNQSKSFKCYKSGTSEFPLLSLSLLDCNKNRRDFFGPVHSIKLQILSKRQGYCQVRTILAKLLYYYTILYYYRQGFGSDTRFIGSGPIFLIFTTPDRDRQISFLIQIFLHMIIE